MKIGAITCSIMLVIMPPPPTNTRQIRPPNYYEKLSQYSKTDVAKFKLSIQQSNEVDSGFFYACQSGNMELVEFTMARGAKITYQGLFWACSFGHLNIVEFFIANGAKDWDSGLPSACKSGNLAIVKLLISQAGPRFKFSWGHALEYAYEGGNSDIIDLVKSFL